MQFLENYDEIMLKICRGNDELETEVERKECKYTTLICLELAYQLENIIETRGPNYFSTMGIIQVSKKGLAITTLRPEKRNYPIAQMPTTEAAINYKLTRDVYLVLGDRQIDGKWTVRTYIKPFANLIWAGCLIMALGALISLSDRRYRVAAGAQSRSRVELEKA